MGALQPFHGMARLASVFRIRVLDQTPICRVVEQVQLRHVHGSSVGYRLFYHYPVRGAYEPGDFSKLCPRAHCNNIFANSLPQFPEWWGTTKYMETCDFQDCRWLTVNPGEAIGPAEWH